MASSKNTIRNLRTAGQRRDRRDQVPLGQWITKSSKPELAQFYDATSGLLFGLLLHALRDTTTAEEVLSRVYVDIRQEADQFDKRRDSLLVWLATAAHWRVYEHLRSSKTNGPRSVLIGPRERRSHPVQNFGLNRSEHQQLVSATLSSLSPTQLQMIELAYFSRLAPLEIALRLGQRLETVKAGLQDGMLQLCRLFNRDFPTTVIKRRLPRIA